MPARLTSTPADPVTLQEAKDHLRLEVGDDDTQVSAAIAAATRWAEEYLWRGIVEQTWELSRDGFPCEDQFELPKGNLKASSVTVKYLDTAGTLQTWSSSAYLVDIVSVPGRVLLPFGSVWPTTKTQWNSVQVTYTVGWAVAAVPELVKSGIKLLLANLYENRTPEESDDFGTVKALLAPYRLASF